MIVSTSSTVHELTDAVLEPPGGVNLLRARARFGEGHTEELDEDERRLVEAIADQSRLPSTYECARCGWYPARRVRLTAFVTILFAASAHTRMQSLCRRCGLRRAAVYQTVTIVLGQLGIGLLATPFMVLRNLRGHWRLRRLPPPSFRAPEVVTPRREPASILVPLITRLTMWAMLATSAGYALAMAWSRG